MYMYTYMYMYMYMYVYMYIYIYACVFLYIFKEATPHSAGPGVAIIITVSKEELRSWEGGF